MADPDLGTVAPADHDVRTSVHSSSAVAGATWSTARLLARMNISMAEVQSGNSGIGGIHSSSTAQQTEDRDVHVQGSWRIASSRVVHRGGVTFAASRLAASSNTDGPQIVATGQSIRGGNEIGESLYSTREWNIKHTVDAPTQKMPWKTGIEIQHDGLHDRREWNPNGRFQLPRLTDTVGIWLVADGTTDVHTSTTTVAMFIEQTVWNRRSSLLRAGIRGDWQNGDGLLISPRIAGGVRAAGFQFSGGGGLFVQQWVPETFAAAAVRSEGVVFRLVPVVSLDELDTVDAAAGRRLHTRIAPVYERRRDTVLRSGVQRRAGPVQLGVEQTWTFGNRLAGATRQLDGEMLVDVVNSDRTLRRQQTHVRAATNWRRHSFVVRYEHVRSTDDTDGTFVHPAVQSRVADEWAPSAGVARHTMAATATWQLPAAIRLTAAYDARIGTRYNVITGEDEEGLGVFTSRGGLQRNAGVLPSTQNLSIYAARSVRLKALRGLAFDIGGRVDNATSHLNILTVGRVAGSPLFQQPLATSPGRSMRVWIALSR
jgi:hypothetical protein